MGKEYLNIGEMSRLFNLNKQTLHYYDQIGLFSPACRDDNGYRKYKFEQCYKLAAICNMRNMGYSVLAVTQLLETMDTGKSLEEMKKQQKIVEMEQQRLDNLHKTLERKIAFVEQENKAEQFNRMFEQEFAARYYYPIGGEESLYRDETFYLNPTLVIYRGLQREFGAYLFQTGAQDETGGLDGMPVAELPPGRYYCGYHFGPYENIVERVEEMRRSAYPLILGEWSVHFNIIDQFMEKDRRRFVTQIQIPIEN